MRGHWCEHSAFSFAVPLVSRVEFSVPEKTNINIHHLPGATQLIRTSLFSLAVDFEKAMTAALLEQYAELFGMVI